MSNITYQLTDGGYQILREGVVWIDQPFDPAQSGFVPYANSANAEAAARAFIAEQPAP
jgi:hypothetical protein